DSPLSVEVQAAGDGGHRSRSLGTVSEGIAHILAAPYGSRRWVADIRQGNHRVDPRQELAIIRRSWKVVLLVGVLAAVVAFVASNAMSKAYESSSRLLVGQALQAANPDVNLFQTSTNLAQTYAVIGETRQLLGQVRTNLKLDVSLEDLISQVSVRPVQGQPMIDINASANSAETAAAIANEIAAELIARAPTIGPSEPDTASTQQDLKDTSEQITQTRNQIQALLAVAQLTPDEQARLDVLQARILQLRATY